MTRPTKPPTVLLFAVSVLQHDARTLNVATTLWQYGWNTTVVADCSGLSDVPFATSHWGQPQGRAWNKARSLFANESHVARHCTQSPTVIVACDVFALPAAYRAARRWRAALVYDMRELTWALASLTKRPITQWILSTLERWFVRRCTAITTSGPMDSQLAQRRFGLQQLPTTILNSPPYQQRLDSTALRQEFSIPTDANILLYQGAVLHGRGLRQCIEVLAHEPRWVLCVLGDGSAKPELQKLARGYHVDNQIRWCGMVPYHQLHRYTCSATVGVTCIEPISESYRYALPNKFFEYMMAGVPQLCSNLPALRSMIARHPVGMLVPETLRVAELREALQRIMVPATYQAMQKRCSEAKQLSYEAQQDVVANLYHAIHVGSRA
jgi:glycosyltransferase involved in cell wall biosynthesis